MLEITNCEGKAFWGTAKKVKQEFFDWAELA